jgi:hypothetical protein
LLTKLLLDALTIGYGAQLPRLVAALGRRGEADEAQAVAARQMELQPNFIIARQCAVVGACRLSRRP